MLTKVICADLLAIPISKQMMANRKPVDVRQFVFVHNVFMAVLSLWMLVESVRAVCNFMCNVHTCLIMSLHHSSPASIFGGIFISPKKPKS